MKSLSQSDRDVITSVLQAQQQRRERHAVLAEVSVEEINAADEERRDLQEEADGDLDQLVPILTRLLEG